MLIKKRILIVEDNPDLRDILQWHIEHQGYDTILAFNGKEAVDLATSQVPDLIIMDMMMPVMDGHQATRMIREHPSTYSTPILAVTARVTMKDKEDCIQSGCDEFIAKPYTSIQLISSIAKLLDQNSKRPCSFPP